MQSLIAFFEELQNNVRPADVLDIIVVAWVLYILIGWILRKASWSVVAVASLLAMLYLTAWRFDMYLTILLFQVGLTVVLIGFILVFQEDLRRGFDQLGTWGLARQRRPSQTSQTIDTLIEAIYSLAEQKIGALIVLNGREPLDRLVRGGVRVNGSISIPLLQSIFHPESPGHDGAVLVQGEQIDKLGVHLPLSQNLGAVGQAGTRHAAALGLAERSDALVLVVSEERGTVSVAHGGTLEGVDSYPWLKERLESFYERVFPRDSSLRWRERLTRKAGLKAASVLLACALWLGFAYQVEVIQRAYTVPVEYRNVPAGWALDEPEPTEVSVTLSGTERAFNLVDQDKLIVSVDLGRFQEGVHEYPIGETSINVPPGMSIRQIDPRSVRPNAYRLAAITVPVKPVLNGELPDSLKLSGVAVEPSRVSLLVPHEGEDPIESVRTEPVDLTEVRGTTTVSKKLILPDGVRLPEEASDRVRVALRVAGE